MDEYERCLLDSQDWDHLLEKLTLYAHRKLIQLFWRGQRGGVPPGGMEPADFALDAISGTYSGERQWNRNRHPEVFKHLQSTVDSLISNAARSSSNKDQWIDDQQNGEFSGSRDADIVYREVSDRDFVKGFLEFLQSEPELCRIVLCIVAGHMKREDIAEQTGLQVAEITNCQKRLARRLTAYLSKLHKVVHFRRNGSASSATSGDALVKET